MNVSKASEQKCGAIPKPRIATSTSISNLTPRTFRQRLPDFANVLRNKND